MAQIWLASLALVALATTAQAAKLEITVTGVRSDLGMIGICVFAVPSKFPDCTGDASVMSRRVAASVGRVRAIFSVEPGIHAVSVFHDENGNGRLDKNFLGIPREGAGVSDNPPVRWGPPRFDDAKFVVPPDGAAITVTMVYP